MYCWDYKPKESRRWHIFSTRSMNSLCLKYHSATADEEETSRGPITARKNDCKKCVREFNEILKRKQQS